MGVPSVLWKLIKKISTTMMSEPIILLNFFYFREEASHLRWSGNTLGEVRLRCEDFGYHTRTFHKGEERRFWLEGS